MSSQPRSSESMGSTVSHHNQGKWRQRGSYQQNQHSQPRSSESTGGSTRAADANVNTRPFRKEITQHLRSNNDGESIQ
jgi:hypothetical protein